MGKNPRGMGAFSKKWRRRKTIKPNAIFNLDWNHPLRKRPGDNPNVFHFTRWNLFQSKVTPLQKNTSTTGYMPMAKAISNALEDSKNLCPSSKYPLAEVFKKIGVYSDGYDLVPKTSDLVEPQKNQKMFKILNFIGENLRTAKRALKNQKNPYLIKTEFSKNARILVDECMPPTVANFLNRNFASAQHHHDFFKGEKYIKDPEVYSKALLNDFNIIVSSDFKMENDQDLSFIAREVFRDTTLIRTKYGARLSKNPIALILMPANYGAREQIKVLSNNQRRVASFLENPQEPILYLV